MNTNKLTDRTFWENYWNSKTNLISDISEHNYFEKIFSSAFNSQPIKTTIELGGFPGYQSIFIKKKFKAETSLFDYFINKNIIEKLLEYNKLNKDDLHVIEGDLFEYKPKEKYDLVFSIGLLEHFENTDKIIELHKNFISDNGILLVIIPNFKGVNGWVQKSFDKKNYDMHYIPCMDLKHLKNAAAKNGLKNVEAYYYGKFSVWLENKDEQSSISKLIVKLIWVLGKLFSKVFPFETKTLSPYIVLMGKK